MDDINCNLDIAVAWCINAKNSLQNVHGFSPFQLVFGRNPRLPGILVDRPPALDDFNTITIIRDNLNALHASRRAFLASESSEKLRRALKHNIRTSGNIKYVTGDKVYYKRATETRWRGPAVVLGQDGQQVLVKHGGIYVRVHPCRLSLVREVVQESQKSNTPENTPLNGKVTTIETESIENGSKNSIQRINSDLDSDSEEEDNSDSEDDKSTDSEDKSNEIVDNRKDKEDDKSNEIEDDQSNDTEANCDNESIDEFVNNIPEPIIADIPEVSRPRGRPPSKSKAKIVHSKNETLRVGMVVKFKPREQDTWQTVKLTSRAGKSNGKYKNEWNTLTDDNNKEVVDFDRHVSEWNEVLDDNTNNNHGEEIHVLETLLQDMEDETMRAKLKELSSWLHHEVYVEVEDKGQKCISVRWVITPKMIDGKLDTKARLCARGFEETSDFRTDSPTCMRESVRLAFVIIATMSWTLHSIDYKTAFLQGNAISREVYLKPPPESKTNKLWKLKKTVYGLADAPRVWFLTLREELLKLNVQQSTYDQGLFYWYNGGILEGVMVCFVDDQVWGGTTEFEDKVIKKLRKTFDINYEHCSVFKYVGIDVKQAQDGSISINQESYLKGVNSLSIDKERSNQKEETVTDSEKQQLRMIIGQLNWLSGISRPDISFRVSELSSSIKDAKVIDLLKANKALRHVKNTQSYIQFPKLHSFEDLRIVVYSDASYANLPNGGSQGGHLVFLSDTKGFCCPLAWHSTKIKRVVRSTLAAETLALVEGLETAFLMAKTVGEIISGKKESMIPIYCKTDNKSLFDAVQTLKTINDKRLRVEMSMIREMVENNEIKISWIRSGEQLADVLTKNGASSDSLCRVLNIGYF